MTSLNTSNWRAALLAVITSASVLLTTPALAEKIGGTTVPDSITIGTEEVPFQGGGHRTRAVFKLYAAGFYANESGEGKAVADADAPMAIHLHILSKLIDKKKMTGAIRTGFKTSTGGDTAPIQGGIDQMMEAMNEKPLKLGVKYTLSYEPGVGTTMARNGEAGTVIEGLEFKQALFGIWLGDKPAQANLKNRMLGK